MFYSQTFLAKKGPLGIVWYAAHLQRLSKSHYSSTHILKTVDQIMTPDVPLALRMSATLLFGVVRIHSIKFDQLHSDYIQLLRRSQSNPSRPAKLSLPHGSTQDSFEDIILPSNYGLDAFDHRLFHFDGSPDTHVLSEDEITLKDKYHATNQLYDRITFGDDTRVPDRELRRDPDENDIVLPSILLQHVERATSKPNSPSSGETTKRRDIDTPNSVCTSTPQMQPRVSPRGSGPSSPRIAGTQFETGSFDVLKTSELELRPSPSLQRRRKRPFDETLVLNNTFLKKALNDTSDLVKKRKKLPSSSLELWRLMNNKNNGRLFLNPLISGMSTSLQYLSSKDLIALNSIPAESPVRGPQFNDETEHHLRSPDRDHGHNFGQVFSPSQQSIFRDAVTSKSARIPSMVTEPGNTDVDMDTPSMNDDQTTARVEDLSFLEQDNNSPPDLLVGSGSDTMSVRTRAVAQYLKNRSPLSRLTDASPDDLSLNAILEGRSRKLSARMFYETLVLNDCRLIDVKQDEPYADIILKLSTGISMAKLD